MYFDLNYVIEQVGKEKGIPKETIIEALEEAILSASKKKYGSHLDLEAHYSEELGEIEVFQFKTVVENVSEPDMEINEEDAKHHDPNAWWAMPSASSSTRRRSAALPPKTAKQIIIQRCATPRAMSSTTSSRQKGRDHHGVIQRVEKNHYIINLGRTEALMPYKEAIPGETYRQRERVKGLILDVEKGQKAA
jgi:N utilization substance protein A